MQERRSRPRKTRLLRGALATGLWALLPAPALAGTAFGIFDARTLGMGGTSVASANNDNAQFYNAALLAFNDEIEEDTRDSRFLFPLMIPQAAESVITVAELSRDDPTLAIGRAVADFNAGPDPATAQSVVDAVANFDDGLSDIDGEDLFSDIYVGLAVSEPGQFQGGGFFIGTRVLVGGSPSVSATDRELLAAYREGLTFIATNGAQGVARPELFDANGALINPGNDFESTVSAAGAVVTEAGVAVSQQLELLGAPIAAGFSFKVQLIDTFEHVERSLDDRIDTARNSQFEGSINFDVGVAKTFGERWRVGLAVKDIVPRNYSTSLGTKIRFRPRARIGARYQRGPLELALDADLTRNEPLGTERATQELAVGAEWALGSPLKLRAGYRHDLEGERDPVVSVGMGTIWRRLAIDVAYAGGGDARAAALQFGLVF